MIKKVVTHPGSAHTDDFLACCILMAQSEASVERREPTAEELDDPEIAVVDVGGVYDPDNLNFDHHHFPRNHPPTCSLSLVLDHLRIYQDALKYAPWLQTAELFDSRGPVKTAKHFGLDPEFINCFRSPIERIVISLFSEVDSVLPETELYNLMERIGHDIVQSITSVMDEVSAINRNTTVYNVGQIKVAFCSLESPRYMREWAKKHHPDAKFDVFVSEDNRGDGWSLFRVDDSPMIDFSVLEGREEVKFAHKNGFIAKTTTKLDESDVMGLIGDSYTGATRWILNCE